MSEVLDLHQTFDLDPKLLSFGVTLGANRFLEWIFQNLRQIS